MTSPYIAKLFNHCAHGIPPHMVCGPCVAAISAEAHATDDEAVGVATTSGGES